MTDEEKEEEILQTKGSMTFCAKGCGYTEKVKELIAIGLAEGRKEICKKILNEIRSHEGIEQLTKFCIAEIIKNIGVEI